MIINKIDFTTLNILQTLYLVRYSHHPHPDYIIVYFHAYNEKTRSISYSLGEYGRIKKINYGKAEFRLFIDKDEMMRSLYDCFMKRNLPLLVYRDLINNSQENRPEIWV